jgi:hypothetical protein
MNKKILTFFLLLIVLPISLMGQDVSPSAEKVNVRLGFRIQVYGVERLRQADEMLKYLKASGFVSNDENLLEKLQDEKVGFIEGIIPVGKESGCLNPRWVYSVTSWPTGAEAPYKSEDPVRIEIQFPQYMQSGKQFEFMEDIKKNLKKIGFIDGIGYNSELFTRITGNISGKSLPAIDSKIFPDALKTAGVLTTPFAFPRIVKVHTDWPLVKSVETIEIKDISLKKMSPSARKKVGMVEQKFEKWLLVLNHQPPGQNEINELFSNLNEAVVEGASGALFEILATPDSIKNLAALPATMFVAPAESQIKTDYSIKQNNLRNIFFDEGASQPARSFRGVGAPSSIAVVGNEFLGWEKAFGEIQTQAELVDLTRTRNFAMEEMPYSKDQGEVGFHTKKAIEVAKVYPGAKIVLVRIDPSIPTMLDEVAGFANGNSRASYALLARYSETDVIKRLLAGENQFLQSERAFLVDQFGQETEIEKRREIYKDKKAKWDENNRNLHVKIERILSLRNQLIEFKSHKVFVLLKNYSSQLPSFQNAALSLFSDNSQFKNAAWLMPDYLFERISWRGAFRDSNRNGIMEFMDDKSNDKWRHEKALIQYESNGKILDKIPQGKKIRVRVRWRESVDWSSATVLGETSPRPKAQINVMVLQNEKQLPGRKIPDEYSVIQETGIEPFCIFRSKNFAIFEHLIEIESSKEGVYSLVLHGKVLIRNDLSSLEAQKTTEIFPEIFLESFEPGTRIKLGF